MRTCFLLLVLVCTHAVALLPQPYYVDPLLDEIGFFGEAGTIEVLSEEAPLFKDERLSDPYVGPYSLAPCLKTYNDHMTACRSIGRSFLDCNSMIAPAYNKCAASIVDWCRRVELQCIADGDGDEDACFEKRKRCLDVTFECTFEGGCAAGYTCCYNPTSLESSCTRCEAINVGGGCNERDTCRYYGGGFNKHL